MIRWKAIVVTGSAGASSRASKLGAIAPLLLASFAAVDHAKADGCTPAAPVSGATVTCTGTTLNQQALDTGYGTQNDDNNTYDIQTGATVTGKNFGFLTGSGFTFNNSGTITSTTDGAAIQGGDGTVNNKASGTITSGGVFGVFGGNLTVNNAGTIQATGADEKGIFAVGTATVSNSGNITALGGGAARAIEAGDVKLTGNTGTISGSEFGVLASTESTHTGSGNADVTNNVGGTITGGSAGILARGNATVANTGAITGTDGFGIFANNIAGVTNNVGGTISGGGFGINATTATVANAGKIQATGADGKGIFAVGLATVSNSGNITALGGGAARAIEAGDVKITGNTGTISGSEIGIFANNNPSLGHTGAGNADVTNNVGGTITGGSDGIVAATATVANAGTISAGANGIGIDGLIVDVNNTGTISGGSDGIVANSARITNTRTISGGFIGIHANTAILTNDGTISGGATGILATSAMVTNNFGGTISAGAFGITADTAAIENAGTISGGSVGILGTAATVSNKFGGTITGDIAVRTLSTTQGSTITNSGTIASTAGATGTAIKLTSAADTLILKPTSKIIGLIDMGGNTADVINVETAAAPKRGLSSLSRSAAAVIDVLKAQLVNFQGTINAIVNTVIGGQPTVTVGGVTAALDPTALAQQDRTLVDFTGGVSSMVRSRLNGAATGGSNLTMMSYAMEDAGAAANNKFPRALGYAPENANAQIFNKAPAASWAAAPVTVWTSAFGGQLRLKETENTLNSTSSAFGAAIGVDRKLSPDWLVGVFAGGGAGTLSVDLSSQKVNTDYVFGGAYSRFEWANQFLDMTVQGGNARNKSTRLVQNNITGGLETASASYNGWFVSPELAYGYRLDLGNGYLLTPTARLRYIAGFFDGYSESGSAQTLSIGSRTLQDLEERAELDLSRTTALFGGEHVLKTNVHGGLIALQRVGDATVSAVLIGQNLTFATPGTGSTVGAVLGAGFDYHTSRNVALFGAVEGIAMSDQSRTITARGGLRVVF
jgi:uncharacterized protein with beta-barrel porin domain